MGNKRRSVYCQHIETEHAYRYVFRHKKEKSDFGVYTGNTFWFHVFALLNYIQTLGETRYSSNDYGLKKARSMWLSMPDLERVRQPDVQPSLYKRAMKTRSWRWKQEVMRLQEMHYILFRVQWYCQLISWAQQSLQSKIKNPFDIRNRQVTWKLVEM